MTINIEDYHLRFFLSSKCNFRCLYCNPDADRQNGSIISDAEVKNILRVGRKKGISKVHYSGGEPTIREELPDIMKYAKELGYTEQVMTTNAALLEKNFDKFIEAGLSRITISIDSLKKDRFNKFTGSDSYSNVIKAIEKASSHFDEIKINVVTMRENLHEIPDFINYSIKNNNKLICRFIELQSNQPVFYNNKSEILSEYVTFDDIIEQIECFGKFQQINNIQGENPNCTYYKLEDTNTKFGIIANHSKGYPCGDCRKIRISPYSNMGVCINAEGINIKDATENELNFAFDKLFEMRENLNKHYSDRTHLSKTYGFWRWGDVSEQKTGNKAFVNIIKYNNIDFFCLENQEKTNLFFNELIKDLTHFKASSSEEPIAFDTKLFHDILYKNVPCKSLNIADTYTLFKEDFLQYCQNPSSKMFLGFPYSGNSIAGVTGAIISDFLNINLVDYKLSEALTCCEIQTILWLRQIVGYSNVPTVKSIYDVGGISTYGASLSNTVALLLARENHIANTLTNGVTEPKKFKIIVPDGITHYGILKSQMLIGCGENLIKIPTENYRMKVDELQKALYENKNNIMCVIAFAGDAKTGTIDNLNTIAEIVKNADKSIWLHADASQGFCLAFSEKLKSKLSGLEKFDSITLDAHKCLNVPFPISTLLTKDTKNLCVFDNKFSDDDDFSFGRITPFISSMPAISLRLWFVLQSFGTEKIGQMIEERYYLAQKLSDFIDKSKDFILLEKPDTFSVMFYYSPVYSEITSDSQIIALNELNKRIADSLKHKNIFLDTPTIMKYNKFNNSAVLKPLKYLCGNPTTKYEDLVNILNLIRGFSNV